MCLLLGACRPAEYKPAPEPPDSAEETSATALPTCDPALKMVPESAVLFPYAFLQLQATGGTGNYSFEITEGDATVGANGALVAGATPGVTNRVTVHDLGCDGETSGTVQVVAPMTVLPATARVAPGAALYYVVDAGSGNVECSFLKNDSGGSLDANCQYQAGPQTGDDQIQFLDRATGQQVLTTVEVATGAVFAIEGQGHLFLPLQSRFVPRTLAGSGQIEVQVLSGTTTADGDGILASAAGSSLVQLRDRYTHETLEVPVEVMAPRAPQADRDGERSLAGVMRDLGDINGDGYADAAFAFIEPSVEAYYGGMVAVYAGGPSGFTPAPAALYVGTTTQETMGRDVAVGDVNNDGHPDLIVGSDKTDRGDTNNGAVRIYYGAVGAFFSATPDRSLYGELSYDRMGSSVAVCDFDGDGYLDLATGALDETNYATALPADEQGAIHVFHGSASGFPDLADFILYGQLPDETGAWQNVAGMHLGVSLAAGDLDGDGLCDLVAGAPEMGVEGGLEDGLVAIYRGTLDNNLLLERTPSALIGGHTESNFGRRLAVADVNGDGAADLAVSAWNDSSRISNSGAAFLYSGPMLVGRLAPEDAGWFVYGDAEDSTLGADLQLVNENGEMQLLVSALKEDAGANENGEIRRYGGLDLTTGEVTEEPMQRYVGLGDSVRLGQAFCSVDDLDGDGYGDLLAFAGYDDRYGVQVGAPYSISGRSGAQSVLALPGEAAGHQIGQGIAFFDVDADGTEDLLVGTPGIGEAGIGANSGAVFLYAGNEDGFSETPDQILGGHPSHSGSDAFGWDLSPAGDFDGDGYLDLAVIARKDSRPSSFNSSYANPTDCPGSITQAGSVLVYRGGPTGLSEEPSFISFGIGDTEYLYEVQGDFDYNGDGYQDLLVGSYTWLLESGGFAVLYGRPAANGLTVICDRDEYHGTELYDFLGSSVASLGDLDGDGCDEIAVGASGEEYSDDYFDQGIVRVLWGWGGPGCRSERTVTTLMMKEVSALAGSSLLGGQDVDGDGIPDLLVGASAHRQAYAEMGAVWMVPGWYLLSLPTQSATATALPELDETEVSILLPDDQTSANLAIIGPVAGDLLGDSLAFIPDPLDPGRSAVVAGLPQGDLGGTPLEGGVGIWRYDPAIPGFQTAPWGVIGGENDPVDGQLGAELIAKKGTIVVAAPLSDAGGGMDVGAVYVARLPD